MMFLNFVWPAPAEAPAIVPRRIEYQLDGVRVEVDAADVGSVPFEDCEPVRDFPTWPGKQHYSGLLYMQGVRAHVGFESLAERSFLIELDRREDIGSVTSQPMWIRWLGADPGSHAPDFFVRFADGSRMLVDVRPLQRIDAEARAVFDRTAVLCADFGWRYVVYSEDSPIRDANVRFLMRFREPRWSVDDMAQVLSGFAGTISEAAERLGGSQDGLGTCYALIWSHRLDVDLEQPLSLRTLVTWRNDA